MRISAIFAFKTGLPDDYSTVFDITDFTNTQSKDISTPKKLAEVYFDNLTTLFEFQELASFTNRGVKIVNNECSISIEKDWDDLRNYDYIALLDGNNIFRFFFIEEIISQNDSASHNSATIKLKWDSWANNLYDLMYPSKTDHNFISNMHLNGWEEFDQLQHRCHVKFHNTAEQTVNGYEKFISGFNSQLRVLFLAIIVDNEHSYYNEQYTYSPVYIYPQGCPPTCKSYFTIYRPIAVIDTSTRTINYDYDDLETANGRFIPFPRTQYSDNNYPQLDSIAVLDAKFTFNPPFSYTFDDINHRVVTTARAYHYFYDSTPDDTPTYSEFMSKQFSSDDIQQFYIGEINGTSEYYNDISLPCRINSFSIPKAMAFDGNPAPFSNYESRILYYPYSYKSYSIGEKKAPVINETDDSWVFRIIHDLRSPRVSIKGNDGEFNTPIYLYSNGKYPTSKSAYEIYINTESNQKNIKTSSALIQMFSGFGLALASVGTGNPILAVSAGTQIFNGINALDRVVQKEKDLRNAFDSIYNISSNALDDLVYQDDIVFTEFIPYYNSEGYKMSLDKLRLYGCNYNKEDKLSKNYRIFFDYKKTAECFLPSIKNVKDRKIIQDAYNKGITRFHMDMYGMTLQSNKDSISTFNQEVTNIELGRVRDVSI